eukprot:12918661-Prorocentrum_lima.AAC.1
MSDFSHFAVDLTFGLFVSVPSKIEQHSPLLGGCRKISNFWEAGFVARSGLVAMLFRTKVAAAVPRPPMA